MATSSKPMEWAINHVPAVNTKATISKALATGKCNVCTGINVTVSAGTAAPTAVVLTWQLRDGATGAGTVLLSGSLGIEATAGRTTVLTWDSLSIKGTTGTAMTLEFTAAGGANTFESVSMTGYIIPDGS